MAAGPVGCNLCLGGSRVQSPGGAELQQTDRETTDITCLFMVYVSAEASWPAVLLLCLRSEVTLSARTLRDVRPMI